MEGQGLGATEATADQLLDLRSAARYLGVTERWIRRQVFERRITYHKLGAVLRFRRSDLDHYLAANRIEVRREGVAVTSPPGPETGGLGTPPGGRRRPRQTGAEAAKLFE